MKIPARVVITLSVLVLLAACAGTGSTSLFDEAGGMSQIRALSDAFVNNVARDDRTGRLLANANQTTLKSKMSDQFCAMTGGACSAPMTDAQIADAAQKVDAPTSRALGESFSGALDTIKAIPGVKRAMTKAIGGKLPRIVAGLL